MVQTFPDSASAASAWPKALVVLFVALAAILVLYADTALSMVEIWARSGTFTHGFLVPPISLWLIWRLRKELALTVPWPNAWFVLVPVATGFIWVLAELAAVGVVSQFALVTMLVFLVPAVLGMPVARRIAFPLAFLYFAVPFGEFAMPFFMEWTAKITVICLRMSGIPVYQEGLQFVIPSGNWSVVEACSGIRYLIASVTVGTLFAYLNYRSLKRRLLFVVVSFLVPIIANWARAYIIVMLGHLSGNKLAAGVDHLIYGWVFFGIVMMLMFWVGSRWREDDSPTVGFGIDESARAESGKPGFSIAVSGAAFLLVTAFWPLAEWQLGRELSPAVARVEPLSTIPGWNASDQQVADWSPGYGNPSASLRAFYESEGRRVGLQIVYYRNQDHERKLVGSTNVLVESSDPDWHQVARSAHRAKWGTETIDARTAVLSSANSQRLLVWHWYWINGYLTSSDVKAKVYSALMRLTGKGDDSAAIFVFTPKEQAGDGVSALEDFAQAAGPIVMDALQRTRETR